MPVTDKTPGKILIIFILSAVTACQLFSQSYTAKHYTTDNGLPHINVRNMTFDRDGFLWIATWDGLSRFDGYNFKNYHHQPGDSSSIPFFSVLRVAVDSGNNLWILTDDRKVSRYNRDKDNFDPVLTLDGLQLPTVNSLTTDNKGALWIIGPDELIRFEPSSEKVERFGIALNKGDTILDQNTYYTVFSPDENTIWLAGLTTYEMTPDTINRALIVRNQYAVEEEILPAVRQIRNYDQSANTEIYISPSGRKWFLSDDGLRFLEEQTGIIKRFTGNIPAGEFSGREFFVWGLREGGMKIYRTKDEELLTVPAGVSGLLKHSLSQGNDIVWVSSTSLTGNAEGLTRIMLTPEYFRRYTLVTDSDKMPAVYSIVADRDKNLWVGVRGRDHVPVITPDGTNVRKYTPASSHPGYYGPVRSMVKTSGGLWIGYFYELLLFYDYSTGIFHEHDAGSLFYRAVITGRDGIVYSGSRSRITAYDPREKKIVGVSELFPAEQFFRMVLKGENEIWVAQSNSTVVKYDIVTGDITPYRISDGNYNVEDILTEGDDFIWAALLGGGVVKYRLSDGTKEVYTTRSGLSNNTVYSLLKDCDGFIWASTDNGISRINTVTGTIKKFGLPEGLDIVEFNSGASLVDEDGRFYFGGMGGVVSFFPDSINYPEGYSAGQEIMITGLMVSGRDWPVPGVTVNNVIRLKPGERNFHISFSATDFASSDRTIYRYRLSGRETGWTVVPHTNRNINYTGLGPGDYLLEIEATDRNGEWKASKGIAIVQEPYYHQRWSFRISAGLVTLFIILAVVIVYISQVRKEAVRVQDQLRLRALQGQMNPHFIFNSLNSINYFISENDAVSANRYISDFARLIRSYLSNMGKDYIPFREERDSLADYLEIEHLRFEDRFDYQIDDAALGSMDDIEVVPGLVQPFVENAIWHGIGALESGKGFIRVLFSSPAPDRLKCIIEDNGIGRKAYETLRGQTGSHGSKGVSIVRERLEIIGKLRGERYELTVSDIYSDRNETGTRVEIDIPLRVIK